jgi:hypothetical protein
MTINRISSNERLSGAVTYKELVFLSGQVPGEGLDVAARPARCWPGSMRCWPKRAATRIICSTRPFT